MRFLQGRQKRRESSPSSAARSMWPPAPGSTRCTSIDSARASHLVLLCKNETGYQNLIYLVSSRVDRGFLQQTPRGRASCCAAHSEGLICPFGLPGGGHPARICCAGRLRRRPEKGRSLVSGDLRSRAIIYIEIQDHGIREQKHDSAADSSAFRGRRAFPWSATNDCPLSSRREDSQDAARSCSASRPTTRLRTRMPHGVRHR